MKHNTASIHVSVCSITFGNSIENSQIYMLLQFKYCVVARCVICHYLNNYQFFDGSQFSRTEDEVQ